MVIFNLIFGPDEIGWEKSKNKYLAGSKKIPRDEDWKMALIKTNEGKVMDPENFLEIAGFKIEKGDLDKYKYKNLLK